LLASRRPSCRKRYYVRLGLIVQRPGTRLPRPNAAGEPFLWIAEIAIVACDLAEVCWAVRWRCICVVDSGGHRHPAFDTVLVLGLQGAGFRQVEDGAEPGADDRRLFHESELIITALTGSAAWRWVFDASLEHGCNSLARCTWPSALCGRHR
jgi:hypothetical protein